MNFGKSVECPEQTKCVEELFMDYTVYILECDDKSYYTGHSRNEQLRLLRHQHKDGAEYTKKHIPKSIVYTESFNSKTEAIRREIQLKKWSHAKKKALIDGNMTLLKKLSISRDHKNHKNHNKNCHC